MRDTRCCNDIRDVIGRAPVMRMDRRRTPRTGATAQERREQAGRPPTPGDGMRDKGTG